MNKPFKYLECCDTCRYYKDGKCRRFPPTPFKADVAFYPQVFPGGWCGEWKLEEPNEKKKQVRSEEGTE